MATTIRRPVYTAPVPGSYEDLLGKLTGQQRDVATAVLALFKQYGLETLAGKIVNFVQQGFSADTIGVMLQETPEYKKRFIANDARLKKGLPALSPAEYIGTERAYRQVMNAAGLPIGFYDAPTDFQKFLETDLSPTEVQERVNVASEAIYQADPATRDYFGKWYSKGDMVAYALDPTRAAPIIERNIRAAEAAATAAQSGVGIGRDLAEKLATWGVNLQQLRQGFGFVGGEQENARKLGDIYGTAITGEDLTSEVFLSDAEAAKKRTKLASQERGSFSGTAGAGGSALSRDRGQS
jgi:hypothetical protein